MLIQLYIGQFVTLSFPNRSSNNEEDYVLRCDIQTNFSSLWMDQHNSYIFPKTGSHWVTCLRCLLFLLLQYGSNSQDRTLWTPAWMV